MRKTRLFWLAAAAGCILIILVTSGCSAIGFGTGIAIDNSLPDTKNIDALECGGIETGTDVEIHMRDGSICKGSFVGLDRRNGFEKKDLDDLPGHDSMQLKTFMTINVVDSTLQNIKMKDGLDSFLGYCGSRVPRDNLKRISIGDIEGIEVPRKKCGKWVGLGLGAAVDVAIIVACIAISSMGPMFAIN